MEYKSIPVIGDNRYNKIYHKPAIDILRVEYYNRFGKDLSLNEKDSDLAMFNGDICEIAYKYLLRGVTTSIIMLDPRQGIPSKKYFLNWELKESFLNHQYFSLYYDFMNESLKLMNNIYFNFIYTYGSIKEIYLSYIPSGIYKSKYFKLYDFLKNLMRNSYINIVWLSDELFEESENKEGILKLIKINQEVFNSVGINCGEYNTLLRKKLDK